MTPSDDNAEHNANHVVDDYLREARASLELHYEDNDPFSPRDPSARLLESIAASLVSIARSLKEQEPR